MRCDPRTIACAICATACAERSRSAQLPRQSGLIRVAGEHARRIFSRTPRHSSIKKDGNLLPSAHLRAIRGKKPFRFAPAYAARELAAKKRKERKIIRKSGFFFPRLTCLLFNCSTTLAPACRGCRRWARMKCDHRKIKTCSPQMGRMNTDGKYSRQEVPISIAFIWVHLIVDPWRHLHLRFASLHPRYPRHLW
jgi:hypothetical protein